MPSNDLRKQKIRVKSSRNAKSYAKTQNSVNAIARNTLNSIREIDILIAILSDKKFQDQYSDDYNNIKLLSRSFSEAPSAKESAGNINLKMSDDPVQMLKNLKHRFQLTLDAMSGNSSYNVVFSDKDKNRANSSTVLIAQGIVDKFLSKYLSSVIYKSDETFKNVIDHLNNYSELSADVKIKSVLEPWLALKIKAAKENLDRETLEYLQSIPRYIKDNEINKAHSARMLGKTLCTAAAAYKEHYGMRRSDNDVELKFNGLVERDPEKTGNYVLSDFAKILDFEQTKSIINELFSKLLKDKTHALHSSKSQSEIFLSNKINALDDFTCTCSDEEDKNTGYKVSNSGKLKEYDNFSNDLGLIAENVELIKIKSKMHDALLAQSLLSNSHQHAKLSNSALSIKKSLMHKKFAALVNNAETPNELNKLLSEIRDEHELLLREASCWLINYGPGTTGDLLNLATDCLNLPQIWQDRSMSYRNREKNENKDNNPFMSKDKIDREKLLSENFAALDKFNSDNAFVDQASAPKELPLLCFGNLEVSNTETLDNGYQQQATQ